MTNEEKQEDLSNEELSIWIDETIKEDSVVGRANTLMTLGSILFENSETIRAALNNPPVCVGGGGELLPCPFCPCGGEPMRKDGNPDLYPRVACNKCGVIIYGRTLAEAIKLWNTRALTTQQPETVRGDVPKEKGLCVVIKALQNTSDQGAHHHLGLFEVRMVLRILKRYAALTATPAEEALDVIKLSRAEFEAVKRFLDDDRWGTLSYMQGPDIYRDKYDVLDILTKHGEKP